MDPEKKIGDTRRRRRLDTSNQVAIPTVRPARPARTTEQHVRRPGRRPTRCDAALAEAARKSGARPAPPAAAGTTPASNLARSPSSTPAYGCERGRRSPRSRDRQRAAHVREPARQAVTADMARFPRQHLATGAPGEDEEAEAQSSPRRRMLAALSGARPGDRHLRPSCGARRSPAALFRPARSPCGSSPGGRGRTPGCLPGRQLPGLFDPGDGCQHRYRRVATWIAGISGSDGRPSGTGPGFFPAGAPWRRIGVHNDRQPDAEALYGLPQEAQ